MVKRTGPTNRSLKNLIRELRSLSAKSKVAIWKRVAKDLERPTRIRRRVNLYKISNTLKDGETALVPGKLLSIGTLTKKYNISAYQTSEATLKKIQASGSNFIPLKELMQKNPQGKKVRLIG